MTSTGPAMTCGPPQPAVIELVASCCCDLAIVDQQPDRKERNVERRADDDREEELKPGVRSTSNPSTTSSP